MMRLSCLLCAVLASIAAPVAAQTSAPSQPTPAAAVMTLPEALT